LLCLRKLAIVFALLLVWGASAFGGELSVNVKSFGAVGDGNTDDAAALQKAINAACPVKYPAFEPDRTSRALSSFRRVFTALLRRSPSGPNIATL